MFFEVLFGIIWRLRSIAVKKKNILLRVITDMAFQGIYFHTYLDSDMYFDIYSDILFVILSGILSGIYSCILSGTLAVLRCSEIDKDSAKCVKLRLPPTGQNYLSKGFGEVSHIKTIY